MSLSVNVCTLVILFGINNAAKLSSTCVGQGDGYQWLKLMDDTPDKTYPAVHVLCDNQYMIIDVDHDSNLKSYFSSWDTYHYALAGTKDKFDGRNWENWWLPNAQFLSETTTNDINTDDDDTDGTTVDTDYFKYVISPSCDMCIEQVNAESIQQYADQTYADEYGDRTGYYMTGTMFGCLASHKALRDCLWDWDSYECGFCTMEDILDDHSYVYVSESDTWLLEMYQEKYLKASEYTNNYGNNAQWKSLLVGLCGVYPQGTYSDDIAPSSIDTCFNVQPDPYKPSIGTDGRYCVCVRPSMTVPMHYDMDDELFSEYIIAKESINEDINDDDDTDSNDDVYELYQSDFEDGTYRITKSGTYVIMEDIEFDFGAPDNWDRPNQGFAWWPSSDQRSEYPGAYSTRDEYFMGFFAGITIEINDVIIDLNSHSIAQSKAFYYQQRQFACISLQSVIFNLNQGPGIFGTDPQFASNVIIKNGDIGLSSHFGIHGIWNDNVLIENVHVYDFETHGIEMSYFTDLTISNVEIGPSSTIAYLKGEYAYARFSLQKMEMIIDNDNGDKTDLSEFPVIFGERDESVTFNEIKEKLEMQMDIAFNYVMGLAQYSEDDEEFVAAKKLFVNDDGLPYGAVMYGLFLNLYVANVFIFHPTLKHANNAEISNLKIHGLSHKSMEYVGMSFPEKARFQNPYSASLDAESLLGDQIVNDANGDNGIDWETVHYVGDALTDAHIAMDIATSDAGITGFTWLESGFRDWVFGQENSEENSNLWTNDDDDSHPYLGCNGDRMSHLLKGVIGIRVDGVDDIVFDGLEIYDLYEHASLPKYVCGKYYDVWAKQQSRTFRGGGHFLQNSPYAYGYTGNMAHGVFADWTSITMKGSIAIHDLYSDTGLIRGIALMVQADLAIQDVDVDGDDGDEETLLEFYNLGAGVELVGIDTDSLSHPFVSAIVQPITVYSESDLYKYEDDDEDSASDSSDDVVVEDSDDSGDSSDSDDDDEKMSPQTFYGTISVPTDDVSDWISVSCVYARDGAVLDDIGMENGDIDNGNCDGKVSELLTFVVNDKVGMGSGNNESSSFLWYSGMGGIFAGILVVLFFVYSSFCGCLSGIKNNKSNNDNEYSRLNAQNNEVINDYGSAN